MRVRFDYTHFQLGDGTNIVRPCLDVVLSSDHGNQPTPQINSIVDTGADLCLFDWALGAYMGFDPSAVGRETEVESFGSKHPARIVSIKMYVPRLKQGFGLDAYFSHVPRRVGLAGILGHIGFLDQFEVTFSRGNYFEITDDRPAEVVPLRPVPS